MTISITDGSTTVTLPPDLVWVDEFSSSQIAQDTKRSLSGAFVVFESLKIQGRPISLMSDDDSGWISRSDLITLRALEEQVDTTMTLSHNGTNYNVRFDRSNGSGVTARAVIDCSDPSNDHKYALSLKLLTV